MNKRKRFFYTKFGMGKHLDRYSWHRDYPNTTFYWKNVGCGSWGVQGIILFPSSGMKVVQIMIRDDTWGFVPNEVVFMEKLPKDILKNVIIEAL